MQRVTLGERAWVKIHIAIQKTKHIQEYMEAHGGQPPPDSCMKKLCKKICPCFAGKESKIAIDGLSKVQKDAKKELRKRKETTA